MRKQLAHLAVAAAVLLAASSASALSYSISAACDGAQETPPVVTPATCTLTGTYDDVTNLLTWSGSFTGLIGTSTDAHFHGPALPGVGPAGVLVATNAGSGDILPLGVTSGVFSGDAVLSALNETRLLGGLIYWNLHSTFRPAGEIRGQVSAVAEPASLALLAIGLGVAGVVRRRA